MSKIAVELHRTRARHAHAAVLHSTTSRHAHGWRGTTPTRAELLVCVRRLFGSRCAMFRWSVSRLSALSMVRGNGWQRDLRMFLALASTGRRQRCTEALRQRERFAYRGVRFGSGSRYPGRRDALESSWRSSRSQLVTGRSTQRIERR